MAIHLARSIAQNTNYDSVVFIPGSEAEDVSGAGLRELRELNSDVVVEETTIPEYGQSAKLDAFAAAAERYSPPYILLNTETLLLYEFNVDMGAADVFANPLIWGHYTGGVRNPPPTGNASTTSMDFRFPTDEHGAPSTTGRSSRITTRTSSEHRTRGSLVSGSN